MSSPSVGVGVGRAAQLERVSLSAVARFFNPSTGVLAECRRWTGESWEVTRHRRGQHGEHPGWALRRRCP